MFVLPLALFTRPWKFCTSMSKRISPRHERKTDLRQDVLVQVRLQGTHLHPQDALALGRQRRQNVLLEPTQHERLELLMQLLDLLLVVSIVQVELVRELNCRHRSRRMSKHTEEGTERKTRTG